MKKILILVKLQFRKLAARNLQVEYTCRCTSQSRAVEGLKPRSLLRNLFPKLALGFIPVIIPAILLLIFSFAFAQDTMFDNASGWIKAYGLVDAKDEPLVLHAERVFQRVLAAADKRGDRFPKLLIIKAFGDPYAQAIKDGSVILSYAGLKICYRGVSAGKGDSRLAFVLGHELAHLAKDDLWHAKAFAALQRYKGDKDARRKAMALLAKTSDVKTDQASQEHARMKEIQADSFGIIYAVIAGYDPAAIIDRDSTNFFEDWASQITGQVAYSDATHPGPKERAEFLRAQLQSVIEDLDYFNMGVCLYQLGRYDKAIFLFDRFKESFPGREVFNNLGLCHYQQAMKILIACDEELALQFKPSTLFDAETLASKFRSKGSSKSCRQNDKYRYHINEAVKYLTFAIEKDSTYLPARINLSAALLMAGDYSKSMSIADEALKIQPKNIMAQNNKAVALYFFSKSNNIDATTSVINSLEEINKTAPSFADPFYNLAFIEEELGREESSLEYLRKYISVEQTGAYAGVARTKLGINQGDSRIKKAVAELRSPVSIGEMSSKTEKYLNGLRKKDGKIGNYVFQIYTGKDLKIMVVDDAVELVETIPAEKRTGKDIQNEFGLPLYFVQSLQGNTSVYEKFAVDVDTTTDDVRKIVYFSKRFIE